MILALETSSSIGSVALVDESALIQELPLEEGLRHGTSLLPAAEKLLSNAGIRPYDLTAVAVSHGPGSYTGIRIGLMAAKALAFGAGIPLVTVSSLAALAWTARTSATMIVPAQDARRDEVYAAVYRLQHDTIEALVPDKALTPEEAIGLALGEDWCIVGSAAEKYRELFAARVLPGVRILDEPTAPSACSVGILGWRKLTAGNDNNPCTAEPVYLRRDDG